MTRSSIIAVLLVSVAACAKPDAGTDTAGATTALAPAPAAPDSATIAATIANAIAANPAKADSILQANGHTAQSFEDLTFRIAADSAMSARYAAARTQ